MRQGDLTDARAEPVEPVDGRLHARPHAGLDALAEGLAHDADPEPGHAAPRALRRSRAAASSRLVASIGSFPAIDESSIAASRTSRVNVPTVSSEDANAISPYRLISP